MMKLATFETLMIALRNNKDISCSVHQHELFPAWDLQKYVLDTIKLCQET